jgi:hypothetical protein
MEQAERGGCDTLTPPYTRHSGRGRFKGSIISNTPFGSFLVLIPLLHKCIMKVHDQSVQNMHINTMNLTSDRSCHESPVRQYGLFLMMDAPMPKANDITRNAEV